MEKDKTKPKKVSVLVQFTLDNYQKLKQTAKENNRSIKNFVENLVLENCK